MNLAHPAILWHLTIGWILIVQANADPLANFRGAAQVWESEIQALEKEDLSATADPQTILFLGSSSIRLWDSIGDDLPGRKVLRRAYGGARFSDLALFIDRLIARHQPRAVVLFVANDISGDPARDLPAQQVIALADYSLQRIRHKWPAIPVYLLAITPTPSRFAVWDQIQLVNQGLNKLLAADPQGHFIDTASHFLDSQGKPRAELFDDDGLHLSAQGYRIWATLLEQAFQRE